MNPSLRSFLQARLPWVYQLARSLTMRTSFRYRYHRRPDSLALEAAYTKGAAADDAHLIDRLTASYRLRAETPSGMWRDFFQDLHGDIHGAILRNDRSRIEEVLRNPVSSDLMYGFDFLVRSYRRAGGRIEDRHDPALTLDSLICLAEALGARPIENTERYTWRARRTRVDEVIDRIEEAFKFPILLPNPYPAEYGLVCKRGIMSYRVPQALYQAWRMSRILEGIPNPRVLEIGGGLGRTAFYARQFGLADYTIIDIPISSLAQGYFLGRALGEGAVRLYGEPEGEDAQGRVKLLAPRSFFEATDRYDLILNADSLTEIGSAAARQYWTAIERRTRVFLSINHEANEVRVADLIRESTRVARATRMPYWMRRGYAEECVEFAG
jgi:hypothetical protein